MPKKFSLKTSLGFPVILTSEPHTRLMQMFSPEASPVRTSALPASESVWQVLALDSGKSFLESSEASDPNTCWWKTCPHCEAAVWERFSEIWPRAGMMRNGIVFPQAPLVPLTGEIAFSLLPTPTASQGGGYNQSASPGARVRPSLEMMAKKSLWPDRKSIPPGQLNPKWVEWLMGFPLGWTDLDV